MTEQRPTGYASEDSPKPSKEEGQACINAMIELHKETIGGTGFAATSKTLASDKFSIEDGCILYTVDTQGDAATDDLSAIEVALGSFLRDGHVIGIKPEDLGHVWTIKHNVGSSKKILLRNGADYTPTSLSEIIWLQYREAADAWYQILPDLTQALNRIMGAQPVATLTPSSNIVTPASGYVQIDSTAAEHVDQISTVNFPFNGGLLLVGWSEAHNYARTLKHNTGGSVDNKLYHNSSADIILSNGSHFVLYQRAVVSARPAWVEVTSFGYGLPTNPAAGDLYVGTGSGGYAVIDGTPSDGMVPTWDDASPNNVKWAAGGGGSGSLVNGCRLSASSTLSNPSTDVTGATSVYLHPHKHDKISLYSGSGDVWNDRVITSLSLSLSGFGVARLVDVYGWDDAGTPKLEGTAWDSGGQVSYTISSLTAANPCVITTTATHAISVGDIVTITQGTSTGTAWTDADLKLTNKFFYVSAVTGTTLTLEGVDTTGLTRTAYTNAKVYKIPASRTTGQTRQNGVLCKTGALTRRFLGTIYIDGSGNLNDAVSQRFCRNVDNKEPAAFGSEDTTASFTPSATGAFYARTNSTQVGKTRSELVIAEAETVHLSLTDSLEWNTYISNTGAAVGINRMLAASFSTYQSVLEFQLSTNGTGASYANAVVTTLTNSGHRSFAAGLYFVQHMQYGAGYPYHGRAYTSYPAQAAVKAIIWR